MCSLHTLEDYFRWFPVSTSEFHYFILFYIDNCHVLSNNCISHLPFVLFKNVKKNYIPGPEGESVVIQEHPEDPTHCSVLLGNVLHAKKVYS